MQPTWSNIYIVQSFQNGDWGRTWKPPPIDRWGAWVDRAVNHYYWQLLLWSISSQCQYCNYNSAENEKEPHHRAITLNYCVENVENTQNPRIKVQLSLKPRLCSSWIPIGHELDIESVPLGRISIFALPWMDSASPTCRCPHLLSIKRVLLRLFHLDRHRQTKHIG